MITARCGLETALLDGKIYAIGGAMKGPGFSAAVERL